MTCHIPAAALTELAFVFAIFMACLVPAVALAHRLSREG